MDKSEFIAQLREKIANGGSLRPAMAQSFGARVAKAAGVAASAPEAEKCKECGMKLVDGKCPDCDASARDEDEE